MDTKKNTGLASSPLTDDEFVRAFENCTLDPSMFHHADHLRIAEIYLNRFGRADAEQRMLAGIQKLAAHLGVPQKFHHTATVAWLRIVALAKNRFGRDKSVGELLAVHPALLDRELPFRHYSKDLWESAAARQSWCEPDIQPIPE